MNRRLGRVLVALGVGCGHPPPAHDDPPRQPPIAPIRAPDAAVVAATPQPPKPLDEDLPQLVAQSVALYTDLAHGLDTAGADCAGATTALVALQARYAPVVLANAKVLRDGRAKELRAALVSHDAELDALAAAIAHSVTLATCAGDAQFAEAFDRLMEPPP